MCDHYDDLVGSAEQKMTDGSLVVTDLYRGGAQIETRLDPDGRLVQRSWFTTSGRRWKNHVFHVESGTLASEYIFNSDGSMVCKFYTEDGTLIPAEEL